MQLRAEWIMNPENLHASVEALQQAQRREKTSLGIVRPKAFVDIVAEEVPDTEREGYWQRYEQIMAQRELPFEEDDRPVNPLPPPDYRFRVHFRCDDAACTRVHNFNVFDWEVDALYSGCRRRGDSREQARDKVIDKLRDMCGDDKDTHLYLGNIFSHQHIFTVIGPLVPEEAVAQTTRPFLLTPGPVERQLKCPALRDGNVLVAHPTEGSCLPSC